VERINGHVVRVDQPLAIELVSTVHVADGEVVDALGTSGQLRSWLHVEGARLARAGRVDPVAAIEPVRALRDALRRLLLALVDATPPRPADVALVNAAVATSPRHSELQWEGHGRPAAVVVSSAAPVAALVAELAADGVALLTGAHGEVRACDAPSCVLFYVPAHPRQAWCSPACGNRARVARHYRRTRA
jgi:predicted RNA-binding Zn ribbon-like protein